MLPPHWVMLANIRKCLFKRENIFGLSFVTISTILLKSANSVARVAIEGRDISYKLNDVLVCLSVNNIHYLSLCDDVEGASLLSLPDDVLSLVIVFLMGERRVIMGKQQSELKHYIDLTIEPVGLIPGSRSPRGWELEFSHQYCSVIQSFSAWRGFWEPHGINDTWSKAW